MPSSLHLRDRMRKIFKRRPETSRRDQTSLEPKQQLADLKKASPVKEPAPVEPSLLAFASYQIGGESIQCPSVIEEEPTCPLEVIRQTYGINAGAGAGAGMGASTETGGDVHAGGIGAPQEHGTPLGDGLDDALYPPSCGSTIKTPDEEGNYDGQNFKVLVPEEGTPIHPGSLVPASQFGDDMIHAVTPREPSPKSEATVKRPIDIERDESSRYPSSAINAEEIPKPLNSNEATTGVDSVPQTSWLSPQSEVENRDSISGVESESFTWNKVNALKQTQLAESVSGASSNYERNSPPSSTGSIDHGSLRREEIELPSLDEGTLDSPVVEWLKRNKPRYSIVEPKMNGDESHELESGYTTNFGSRPNEGSQQPSSDLISDHQASGQLQQEHLQRINQPDRVQIPLGEVSGHSVEPPSSIFGGTKTYTTEVSLPPTNSVAHQHEADIYSSHIPSKSTDADFNVTVNPPVIHEQNMEQNREITTKKVTRDIHTHDHYTRVQPIIKSEYLPTKHVLLENGVEKELNQQEVEANIYPASRRVDEVIATSMRKSQYY